MLKQPWQKLDLDMCIVTESVCDALRTEVFVDENTTRNMVAYYQSQWLAQPERWVPSVTYPLLDVTHSSSLAEMFVNLFPHQNPWLLDRFANSITRHRPVPNGAVEHDAII